MKRSPQDIAYHDAIGDCLEWNGTMTTKGYGQLVHEGRTWLVHRFFEQKRHGSIPEGVIVEHICDNPLCYKDEHLLRSSIQRNTTKALGKDSGFIHANSLKTTCLQGHTYNEENIYRDGRGHRQCKQCRRERCRVAAAERRALDKWFASVGGFQHA